MLALNCEHSATSDPDELARLNRSIDALRDAENREKAPYLAELRSQGCSSPRTCELRRICIRAYAMHLDALTEVDEVSVGEDPPRSAREKLDAAKNALLEAERRAQECVEAQAGLSDSKAR